MDNHIVFPSWKHSFCLYTISSGTLLYTKHAKKKLHRLFTQPFNIHAIIPVERDTRLQIRNVSLLVGTFFLSTRNFVCHSLPLQSIFICPLQSSTLCTTLRDGCKCPSRTQLYLLAPTQSFYMNTLVSCTLPTLSFNICHSFSRYLFAVQNTNVFSDDTVIVFSQSAALCIVNVLCVCIISRYPLAGEDADACWGGKAWGWSGRGHGATNAEAH